jgi:site-specific DNA-methyltransferase (adenine-specific)
MNAYAMNTLYYGDNLSVLRQQIEDQSVDLVYLDPPFNSNANYNVLFRSPAGEQSRAQIEAFEDTWHWNDTAEEAFDQVIHSGNTDVAEMLRALRSYLRENDMMAYLTMMSARLIELHRVLRPTGSLYLHCDSSASHYLKVLMDGIFGGEFFKNEIVWQRTNVHNDSKTWSRVSDTILFYTKTNVFTWNKPVAPHSEEHIASKYSNTEKDGRRFTLSDMTSPAPRPNMMYEWKGFPSPPNGWRYSQETMQRLNDEDRIWYPHTKAGAPDTSKRPRLKRYLNEMAGTVMGNIWTDISPINSQAQERLGYPTQKPLALMERIITASSNEGDVVLDPFCGCGTTIHAAQKLNRQWVGIDITHLAISLIETRLKGAFPGVQFVVHGTPTDLAGARELASRDKHQFQLWATSRLPKAQPYRSGRKGADSGIDAIIYFQSDGRAPEKAIVSVKGGENVNVSMVRDLGHVVEREKAKAGVFVTLTEPTGPMRTEATKAGYFETPYGKYPRLQILTVSDLLEGKKPNIPLVDSTPFRNARRESTSQQNPLF